MAIKVLKFVNGIPKEINPSVDSVAAKSFIVGGASGTELTKVLLDSLLGGGDASSLHNHDTQYYGKAEVYTKAEVDAAVGTGGQGLQDEIQNRIDGDTALGERIDDAETVIATKASQASLNQEISDREAADLAVTAAAEADATAKADAAQAAAIADALATYIPLSQKGANSGVATLDSNGKILTSQLGAIAITDVFVVADIAARDALVVGSAQGEVQQGDVAVVIDADGNGNKSSFIYTGSAWVSLNDGTVISVNGQTGSVVLSTSDIAEGSNLYYTEARFNTAFAAKSTSDLAEGINLYFTDARAQSAVAQDIADAVAAEALLRSDADTTLDEKIDDSIAQEVLDRNSAISSAIAQEVTDRDSAISGAIAQEVTDRNTAISTAVSAEESRALAAEALKLNKAGDTMSGDLIMGANQVKDILDGTDDQDAVSKAQLDAAVNALTTAQGNYVPNSEKGAANGVATLNADGKLSSGQIPAIAITDTFVVADEAAMLALSTAEAGDVAVRQDLSKSFILVSGDPSVLSNWQELLTPTSAVTSVNGQQGDVVLTTEDVAEAGDSRYYTTARQQDIENYANGAAQVAESNANAYTSTEISLESSARNQAIADQSVIDRNYTDDSLAQEIINRNQAIADSSASDQAYTDNEIGNAVQNLINNEIANTLLDAQAYTDQELGQEAQTRQQQINSVYESLDYKVDDTFAALIGEDITAGDLLVIGGLNTFQGQPKFFKASSAAASNPDFNNGRWAIVGVALESAVYSSESAGTSVQCKKAIGDKALVSYDTTPAATDAGKSVYLGTDGKATLTPPTAPGSGIVYLGICHDHEQMHLCPAQLRGVNSEE